MSSIQHIEQTDPPRPPKETLPTMYDLPSEDPEDSGLPDEFHLWQPQLLSFTFRPPTYSADQIFTASDLNLYYDLRHPNWYKRPDWFAVVGISRLYEAQDLRLSYVMWQEGVRPIIAIELLSPGTQAEDLGETLRTTEPPTKSQVYEQILGIPYYVTFDRYSDQLRAFMLVSDRYQELELQDSKIWIPTLGLGLGLWQGQYREIDRQWLRWYDIKGNWVSTETEMALQRAEESERLLAQERQRAERLAERLRALGIGH